MHTANTEMKQCFKSSSFEVHIVTLAGTVILVLQSYPQMRFGNLIVICDLFRLKVSAACEDAQGLPLIQGKKRTRTW